MKHRSHSAFSLLEMAIVVAIVGILLGAIVATQDFMRKAEIADAIAESEALTIAYNKFLERFKAIPGDFDRAENTWGARSTCPPTPGVGLDGTNTCDGNGDKDIQTSTLPYEQFLLFQHLSLAKLLPGTYTGAASDAGDADSAEPAVNVPVGSVSSSAYYIKHIGNDGIFQDNSMGQFFPGRYGMTLYFGRHRAGYVPHHPIITPEEMYRWDSKVDDARPATGRVVSYKGGYAQAPDCATSAATTALYKIAFDGVACTVMVKLAP